APRSRPTCPPTRAGLFPEPGKGRRCATRVRLSARARARAGIASPGGSASLHVVPVHFQQTNTCPRRPALLRVSAWSGPTARRSASPRPDMAFIRLAQNKGLVPRQATSPSPDPDPDLPVTNHESPADNHSITNFPKATPRSQPLPVPARASETSPLVMTWALLDLAAPAWTSAVA